MKPWMYWVGGSILFIVMMSACSGRVPKAPITIEDQKANLYRFCLEGVEAPLKKDEILACSESIWLLFRETK